MKGSMTVEASYVYPFCFLVILIVCYLGIYLYDRSVLITTGYECILSAVDCIETSEADLKERLSQNVMKMANARALGMEQLHVSVKITASKISVSCSGSQGFLKLPMEVGVVYERVYPELTLRMLTEEKGE